jgi:hypothetical protein
MMREVIVSSQKDAAASEQWSNAAKSTRANAGVNPEAQPSKLICRKYTVHPRAQKVQGELRQRKKKAIFGQNHRCI